MPSTTCLKQGLSIDTTLDSSLFSLDSPFNYKIYKQFRAATVTSVWRPGDLQGLGESSVADSTFQPPSWLEQPYSMCSAVISYMQCFLSGGEMYTSFCSILSYSLIGPELCNQLVISQWLPMFHCLLVCCTTNWKKSIVASETRRGGGTWKRSETGTSTHTYMYMYCQFNEM
jgi:hypothetical protein